ncbi:MAG: inositol monophosphatase family protein [Vicingaceae bacterium]
MQFDILTKKACQIIFETGKFIKQQQITAADVEVKSKNSLVSFVDKEAEKMLVSGLSKLLPESGFLTEEETVKLSSKSFTWIIDPLDGTTNFIHQIPSYSISVALMHENQLVLGIVFEINLNEMFYAYKKGGAFLNDKKISVSNSNLLENALIATGFPYYDYTKEEEYMLLFKDLMKATRGLRRLGSAAVDLAYTACGRFDVFYEYSLNPWDVAAGAFIVQQAGGRVVDFSGGNDFLFGKEIIASNPFVFEEFLQKIKQYF